jgi:hypothetical protein
VSFACGPTTSEPEVFQETHTLSAGCRHQAQRQPCDSGAESGRSRAALRSSRHTFGAYYRRMCAGMDKGKAVTAAAHKLACLIYLINHLAGVS